MKINDIPGRSLDPLVGGRSLPGVRGGDARDRATGTDPVASPAASVSLSERSRELHAVLAAAAAAADVRAERVDAIRRQLDAGTYRIDPVAVARAMLERSR